MPLRLLFASFCVLAIALKPENLELRLLYDYGGYFTIKRQEDAEEQGIGDGAGRYCRVAHGGGMPSCRAIIVCLHESWCVGT